MLQKIDLTPRKWKQYLENIEKSQNNPIDI